MCSFVACPTLVLGFHKILKKFDKWNKSNLKDSYIKSKLSEDLFYTQIKLTEMLQIQEKEIKVSYRLSFKISLKSQGIRTTSFSDINEPKPINFNFTDKVIRNFSWAFRTK